ncbi:hypothetical protein JDV02_010618 [Purpureocillium takamizusanense]|uniref:Secreted protein n=1 Tax=Purpureocillium takamizusanense TaxID=2060973 RepID=A0A9Q8QUC6_9HYPO|nr:uncharacterized protein JDV02_010618 [Purpureocillium takamizusanense]UNI24899.1 hypothetical protein JDV02_010618 [Purpureocillium takamizusanense]
MQFSGKLTAAALVLLFAGSSVATPVPGAGESSMRGGGGGGNKYGAQQGSNKYGQQGGSGAFGGVDSSASSTSWKYMGSKYNSAPGGGASSSSYGNSNKGKQPSFEQMKKDWDAGLDRNFGPGKHDGNSAMPKGATGNPLSQGSKQVQ